MSVETERRDELAKLKIADLKLVAGSNVPSKLKKKTEIIDFIIRKEFPPSSEDIKRIKIAPVFAMAAAAGSAKKSSDCQLCEGQQTVWCELGLAACPICCKESVPSLPSPSIKQERGVTNVPYRLNSEGKIFLDIGSVNSENLISLVSIYGFGLCEAIEALAQCGTLEVAVEFLTTQNRSSAENSSIAEAQLNSEQARDESKESQKNARGRSRDAVREDLTVLLEVDEPFCSKFIFSENPAGQGRLLSWVLEAETNRILLFDYLIIKRDSIKWYKKSAKSFFAAIEERDLTSVEVPNIRHWLEDKVRVVQEALFDIPVTGGSLPVLFREPEKSFPFPNDEEIEILDSKPNSLCSEISCILIE
jgi:hypothetical protein